LVLSSYFDIFENQAMPEKKYQINLVSKGLFSGNPG